MNGFVFLTTVFLEAKRKKNKRERGKYRALKFLTLSNQNSMPASNNSQKGMPDMSNLLESLIGEMPGMKELPPEERKKMKKAVASDTLFLLPSVARLCSGLRGLALRACSP